ncbi:hypothetical protein F5Y18DRAFT_245786 [Xylariaceae sp. FL1019]|nr:hypothetical protein F5Y18DRAFT_245786 [Xylariaceae sp. FL1019]
MPLKLITTTAPTAPSTPRKTPGFVSSPVYEDIGKFLNGINNYPTSPNAGRYKPDSDEYNHYRSRLDFLEDITESASHGFAHMYWHQPYYWTKTLRRIQRDPVSWNYEVAYLSNDPDLSRHVFLTFNLALETIRDVRSIVKYKWRPILERKGSLGPGEGEHLDNFIKSASDAIDECIRLMRKQQALARENKVRGNDRAFCLRVYKILRTFPLSSKWKGLTGWEERDSRMSSKWFKAKEATSWCYELIGGLSLW